MNHYTQLTLSERCKFKVFLDMNLSVTEIAARMGYHRSTLYRELKRNSFANFYKPKLAHVHMLSKKQRKCFIQLNPSLQKYVRQYLKLGWSPEQIAARLKRKKSKYAICHETIYRYIYNRNLKLYKYLAFKKPRRLKPKARKPQKCRYGEKRIITARPDYITKRKRVGHWEGDLIEFKGNKKQSVTTLVERKTRMLILIKNESKESESVMGKIYEKLARLPKRLRRSITFDQGSEFAKFDLLEVPLKAKVFYCHPYAPWEKGSNENMNGRLRWHDLPKTTNVCEIT